MTRLRHLMKDLKICRRKAHSILVAFRKMEKANKKALKRWCK